MLQQSRVADVRRRVTDAEQSLVQRHGVFGDSIRHTLGQLRHGLDRAHEQCGSVGDRAWAEYVSDLDRGLSALDSEVARAVEAPNGGPAVTDTLVIHSTALELTGWRLRFSLLDEASGDRSTVEKHLSMAEQELQRCRTAQANGDQVGTTSLEQSVRALRGV